MVLNVTAVSPTAATYVTAWPTDSARPGTSNLNVGAGETPSSWKRVRLGQSRRVSLFNANGSVHLYRNKSSTCRRSTAIAASGSNGYAIVR